jgi:hypothetical protein
MQIDSIRVILGLVAVRNGTETKSTVTEQAASKRSGEQVIDLLLDTAQFGTRVARARAFSAVFLLGNKTGLHQPKQRSRAQGVDRIPQRVDSFSGLQKIY